MVRVLFGQLRRPLSGEYLTAHGNGALAYDTTTGEERHPKGWFFALHVLVLHQLLMRAR